MRAPRASIKKKLVKLSLISSSLGLLLACSAFFGFDLFTFKVGLVRALASQAQIVGANSVESIQFHDMASATNTLSTLETRPSISLGAIFSTDGKPFAVWRANSNQKAALPRDVPDHPANRFDWTSVELFQPIVVEGRTLGTVFIRSDLSDLKGRLRQYVAITLATFVLTFLITYFFIANKLSEKIIEPIVQLAKTAETVSAQKDYSVRAIAQTQDEVGQLVETFNQMLAEIQASRAELQSSHDQLDERIRERTSQLEIANKEATRLNKFLDSILENIPNMLFVKDAHELKFVRLNKAGESLLGFSRDALIGKNDYDFFPKDEADFFTEKDRHVIRNRQLFDIPEEPIQTKTQGTRTLHTKKIPIFDENGHPEYLLGISEDITEHKQKEEAIRSLNVKLEQKARQMELTNKELETFSYSVSHDLRAPLRAIDGFSLALLEDSKDMLDETGKDHLKRIRAASQQMAQLIDDMLNLSQITRGEFNLQPVNLSELALTIFAELQKSEPHRKINISVAEHMVATGDPRLLRIALENLLANAWKFTGKKPNATVEFRSANEEGTNIYFIRDNGAGFDMTYKDKLFRPFQRLHSAGDFSGTGVGLATVQRVIRRHGGRIWAEGHPGQGATFYFTLG